MRQFLLAALAMLLAAPLAWAQSAGYRIQPGDSWRSPCSRTTR